MPAGTRPARPSATAWSRRRAETRGPADRQRRGAWRPRDDGPSATAWSRRRAEARGPAGRQRHSTWRPHDDGRGAGQPTETQRRGTRRPRATTAGRGAWSPGTTVPRPARPRTDGDPKGPRGRRAAAPKRAPSASRQGPRRSGGRGRPAPCGPSAPKRATAARGRWPRGNNQPFSLEGQRQRKGRKLQGPPCLETESGARAGPPGGGRRVSSEETARPPPPGPRRGQQRPQENPKKAGRPGAHRAPGEAARPASRSGPGAAARDPAKARQTPTEQTQAQIPKPGPQDASGPATARPGAQGAGAGKRGRGARRGETENITDFRCIVSLTLPPFRPFSSLDLWPPGPGLAHVAEPCRLSCLRGWRRVERGTKERGGARGGPPPLPEGCRNSCTR